MGDEFGKLERRLAQILHRFPGLKSRAKRIYQKMNYLLHKKDGLFLSGYELHTIPLETEFFFGYYDKSPLSKDGKWMLFHEALQDTSLLPNKDKKVNVCVYDMDTGEVLLRLPTFSYNWQQGTRAQWIGTDKFVFNEYNFTSRTYNAVIFNLKTNQKQLLSRPVYDCFKDQYALGLDFRRLMALRPDYGYRNTPELSNEELNATDKDGIYYLDLKSDTSKLIISLTRLKKFNPLPEMAKALHLVNHIMIAPDGAHFIFLHRYFIKDRKYDRLFVADWEGDNLELLADDGMVSHCCWLDPQHVIGYLRDKALGDRYYKINIATKERSIVGKDKVDRFGDGHPSVFQNSMIFDTYPDKARRKHLLLYDLDTKEMEQLGEFYESFRFYGETRCDLHPRFNYDGTKLFFDSVHEGKRRLYWLNL